MKHVPNGREESKTARDWDREPINKQPGVGTCIASETRRTRDTGRIKMRARGRLRSSAKITPWRVSHSDVGDSSVPHRGRVFKEKDRPYVQSTSGLTSFNQNDDGEQKIHNGAGRNRKHQERVKRKMNTMIEQRSIMRSGMKHTKKTTRPERRRLMT